MINENLVHEMLSVVGEIPEDLAAAYGQIARLIEKTNVIIRKVVKNAK